MSPPGGPSIARTVTCIVNSSAVTCKAPRMNHMIIMSEIGATQPELLAHFSKVSSIPKDLGGPGLDYNVHGLNFQPGWHRGWNAGM